MSTTYADDLHHARRMLDGARDARLAGEEREMTFIYLSSARYFMARALALHAIDRATRPGVSLSKCGCGEHECAYHRALSEREYDRWFEERYAPDMAFATAEEIAAGWGPLVYLEPVPAAHQPCNGCQFCEGDVAEDAA